MILKHNYEIDFMRYNSINSLLGLQSKLYTSGFKELENMVNILTINSILVNIDIIPGSYFNGFKQTTIYSFFSNASPGDKFIEIQQYLLYLPITSDTIHSITICLTGQKGSEINLREHNLSMRIHLRD